MLRIKNLELIILKARVVTVAVYSAIIRSAVVENDLRTFFVRELISRQAFTFTKITFFIKKPSSLRIVIFVRLSTFVRSPIFIEKAISLVKKTPSIRVVILIRSSIFIFFVRETPFIETSRIVIINEYRSSHINVKNVIVFVFLKMKKAYNARHQFIFFKVEDLVNLRFHKGYKISAIISKKIKPQLIRSFKILERIERLIYRLKLPINIKIHDVIFIAHLKSIIDPAEDPYRRRYLLILIVIVDGEKEYEIEKLLRKRIIKRDRE